MKILVLDDEKVRHDWFKDFFAKEFNDVPVELHHAWHANTARDLMFAHQFDVVFFDHDLGVGCPDGSEAAAMVCDEPQLFNRPRIVFVHSHNPSGADAIQSKFTMSGIECHQFSFMHMTSNRKYLATCITKHALLG